LLKKYNNLWVFGDSYMTPGFCVDPKDSFWGLLAQKENIPTINNCSRPSNSFDTVCHLLVSMSNNIDWANDLILIGIPTLERITIFDNHKNTRYSGKKFSTVTWESSTFDINYHRGLISLQNYGQDKQLILHSDRSWVETQILRELFLLTKWLDGSNANYMILNLSKDLDKNNSWGPSEFVLPYCINHPRLLIFENTYHSTNLGINKPADYDRYGWNGHHGAAGNQYFFEKSLLPTMKKCELIC
jgi:hypothetical protein